MQLGAIVKTNKGLFLVGIPIGNSTFQGKDVIGIGLGAPLGQLMLHKKEADQVVFNNQQFIIEEIYWKQSHYKYYLWTWNKIHLVAY